MFELLFVIFAFLTPYTPTVSLEPCNSISEVLLIFTISPSLYIPVPPFPTIILPDCSIQPGSVVYPYLYIPNDLSTNI